ncbi:MAG: 5'/3'-nucleotidase SurE [bacterium]
MLPKLILLTNDDGVNSDGIKALKKALDPLGEVVVFAPDSERSGSGHSLTMHEPVRIKELEKNIFSVSGFPADCVYAALHGVLKRKPDMIFSGINRGANMGVDVYYSGTVAGVRQGVIDGLSNGISVSLVVDKNETQFFWDDAANFVKDLAIKMLNNGYTGEGFINVNYPNISKDKIKGVAITTMGDRHYVKEVKWGKDPRGGDYCWLWGDYANFSNIPGTDCVAVDNGYISVTPILLDVTDRSMVDELKKWNL